jgi:predicted PurR-regulated permease PerM
VLSKVRAQTSKIEESTRSVMTPSRDDKSPVPVEIQESPGLTHVIAAGGGALGDIVLAVSFVPFLVFFMLTWKDHAHLATVRLFPKEHHMTAHRTAGRISTMIRSFMAICWWA